MKNLMAAPAVLIAGLVLLTGCAALPNQDVAEAPESAGCVMIEATFIEVSGEDLEELGIDWLLEDYPKTQIETQGKKGID